MYLVDEQYYSSQFVLFECYIFIAKLNWVERNWNFIVCIYRKYAKRYHSTTVHLYCILLLLPTSYINDSISLTLLYQKSFPLFEIVFYGKNVSFSRLVRLRRDSQQSYKFTSDHVTYKKKIKQHCFHFLGIKFCILLSRYDFNVVVVVRCSDGLISGENL